MKKNIIKIILDVVMLLLLLLMYSINATGISFHEIGGLAVCALFLIHNGLNWKWIVKVSKRLFDKSLPVKTKLGYAVNVLLFIMMIIIAISGIMISKTIFTSIYGDRIFWKTGHLFASAVSLVLAGIHVGLHWSFIKSIFSKLVKLPNVIARPLAIMCLTGILIYGGYSIAATDFSRWLASPFIAQTLHGDKMPHNEGSIESGRPHGNQGSRHGLHNGSFSPGRMTDVIASYGSITAIFAALTVLLEKILKKKKML
ncbi:DUF4405 domain-containing protein [Phosphitispora sp. TUW77]|uniref:DUF4405 domain-containing protein n=1 Tax=Phosphitispora sp. TUW77 TaxID=3152361 RepID=UPI003AB8D1AA